MTKEELQALEKELLQQLNKVRDDLAGQEQAEARKKEAERQVNGQVVQEKANKILGLVRELEKEAKEKGVGFDFSVAYGMGGWFSEDDYEWHSSSANC